MFIFRQGLEQELAALEPQESIVKKIHFLNDQTSLLQQEISDIADQSKDLIGERERYNDIIRLVCSWNMEKVQ